MKRRFAVSPFLREPHCTGTRTTHAARHARHHPPRTPPHAMHTAARHAAARTLHVWGQSSICHMKRSFQSAPFIHPSTQPSVHLTIINTFPEKGFFILKFHADFSPLMCMYLLYYKNDFIYLPLNKTDIPDRCSLRAPRTAV